MRPLSVTAHLAAGITYSAPWGVALDGLLAAQIHADAKTALEDAGGVHTPILERDDVVDLDLPLARCERGDDWHWAATTAWPAPIEGDDLDVRAWHSFPDHDMLEALTSGLPRHVDDDRGRWRRYAMPQLVTVTPTLTWRAVGDVDTIRDLLAPIRAIGKSRARGEGAVSSWHVHPEPGLDAWEAGHLHPDGALGRPCPPDCLTGRGPITDGGIAVTGIRPPYLHPSRRRRLHRPVLWHTTP